MSAVAPVRNPFPVAAAIALGAAVFAGFARTYYLKFLFGAPPLTVALHLHGLLATAWLVLHFVQARLIAAHRVAIHRRLGILAALVGYGVAAQALIVGVLGARAGHAPPGRDPLQFLSVPVITTIIFALTLTAALLLRKRRDWHKRLMFLATLGLLVPAIGRFDVQYFRFIGMPRGLGPLLVIAAFLAWAMVDDWRRERRLHPALIYVGAALLLSGPLRIWIGTTAAWLPIAHWLTS